MVVDTINGKLRIRQWPKKRPGKRNQTNEYWTQWLRQAMALYKYAQPSEVQIWRDAVHGLPVKITDVYTAVMRGTMWALAGPDGTIYYPTQAGEKVSYSLDAIAQIPGSLLVRGDTTWQGIPPANDAGMILLSNGLAVPQWVTPTEAGLALTRIAAIGTNSNAGVAINRVGTNLPLATVDQYPSDAGIWNAAAPTEYVIQEAGIYTLSAYIKAPKVHWNVITCDIVQNGSAFLVDASFTSAPNATDEPQLAVSTAEYLNAGDVITVQTFQDSGANRTMERTRLTAVRIG